MSQGLVLDPAADLVEGVVGQPHDAARGVPGWASRAGVGSVPSRAHMARVAADPSSYHSLPDKIAALVAYPGCPPVMLRRLPVYYSMENPACPPDVLARRSLSADRYDRERTARHPNCPPGALKRLADDDFAVSQAAANNPGCPPQARQAARFDLWEQQPRPGSITDEPHRPATDG